ncbi:MbtH family NRPS accessory protein [Streptomyces sp. ST2-7A]|uniref:MbtH family protein n=1 Tax=Streptomyces sp. ST2-7A TaxID=2907214 RepID=UPI001F314E8F|nr:MbtH family NRPS accessory protein [Streptomyces sp. ST2-7A]MCE7082627.1 MbtH family NRPS accessory protein [Streptomyces sp. ST2-7A]
MSQTNTEHPDDTGDTELYVVVTNHEEQYSIWPGHRDVPPGWETRTSPMARQGCLEYIREHWVDMRPLSLRERERQP